jgi:hypothetical protein
MNAPAPKPPNFAEMCDSWNDQEAFAAQVAAYYALLGAERGRDSIDLSAPRRSEAT